MWVPDMLMSALFLTVLVILYLQFAQNLNVEHEAIMDQLIFDADTASVTLLSAGYPPGWNESNVERPGLTNNDQRLNLTKLGYMANLSYEDRKWLLGTTFDYYIWFEETDANRSLLNITAVTNVSNPGVGPDGGMGLPNMTRAQVLSGLNPAFQIRQKRYLIYNGSTITLTINMWRESAP